MGLVSDRLEPSTQIIVLESTYTTPISILIKLRLCNIWPESIETHLEPFVALLVITSILMISLNASCWNAEILLATSLPSKYARF